MWTAGQRGDFGHLFDVSLAEQQCEDRYRLHRGGQPGMQTSKRVQVPADRPERGVEVDHLRAP
jgi:hypothetical protein